MPNTLRDIQNEWNHLVRIAQQRGINVEPWARLPPTRDRGMTRLNWLRQQLGISTEGNEVEITEPVGARLSMREMQQQWNALVPTARERGLNVNPWQGLPPTARRGMQRLAWLRSALGDTVSAPAIVAPVSIDDFTAFAGLTFGVEIECYMPSGMSQTALALHIRDAGIQIAAETYNHHVRANWKIVTDGSLGNYTRGIEIVSPPLTADEFGFAQLKKVCDVLVARRVRVSKKCGFHVHVGARGREASFFRNLVRLYKQSENAIDSVIAPSRRGSENLFCRPHVYSDITLDRAITMEQVINACGQSSRSARDTTRYRKLNLQSMMQHGTVEFRQHQGTIEPDKTEQWVRFCLRMVVAAARGLVHPVGSVLTLDQVIQALALSEKEATYFRGRRDYFIRKDQNAANRLARRQHRWNGGGSDRSVGLQDTLNTLNTPTERLDFLRNLREGRG